MVLCCARADAALLASMVWAACPPDILAKCFKSQQDYVDNSAAACACTSWRDTFRGCAEDIRVQLSPLNQAALPSTYLRQFKGLCRVEVAVGPKWIQQHSGSWLTAGDIGHDKESEGRWTETVRSIPASCCWLKLYSLCTSFHIQSFPRTSSHASNLRSVHIYSHHRSVVSFGAFSSLLRLQLLSLVGRRSSENSSMIFIHGSLQELPIGITNLQLSHCRTLPDLCLQELPFVPNLTHLDISFCTVSFGKEAEVADLHQLQVMVLDGAKARCPDTVVASLMTATQLQELNLRNFLLSGVDEPAAVVPIAVLPLGELLLSLQSLQKLDVTSCRHVQLGPSEYTQLRLHSFACHYSQLNIVDAMPFKPFSQPFQARDGNTVRPTLQV